jgi:hypothetical protein
MVRFRNDEKQNFTNFSGTCAYCLSVLITKGIDVPVDAKWTDRWLKLHVSKRLPAASRGKRGRPFFNVSIERFEVLFFNAPHITDESSC